MKAYISAVRNGTRFFITSAGLPTDIPERAAVFRDLTDANWRAAQYEAQPGFAFGWHGIYRLHDGAIADPAMDGNPVEREAREMGFTPEAAALLGRLHRATGGDA